MTFLYWVSSNSSNKKIWTYEWLIFFNKYLIPKRCLNEIYFYFTWWWIIFSLLYCIRVFDLFSSSKYESSLFFLDFFISGAIICLLLNTLLISWTLIFFSSINKRKVNYNKTNFDIFFIIELLIFLFYSYSSFLIWFI